MGYHWRFTKGEGEEMNDPKKTPVPSRERDFQSFLKSTRLMRTDGTVLEPDVPPKDTSEDYDGDRTK